MISKRKYIEKKNKAEMNCEHIGYGDDYYPFMCRVDTEYKDCEGKCKNYKPFIPEWKRFIVFFGFWATILTAIYLGVKAFW